MFYILHGDNEFEISERLADFKQKIGDESLRDLNITVLDGRKTTLSEVQHAADAIPFLADKRLVIVDGLLTRLASRKAREGDEMTPSGAAKDFLNSLIDYVPHLPETTRLVFVEFQLLNPRHQLIKLAEQQKGRTVIECRQPAAAELPRWISERAKKHGGSIESAAAQRLAALIGSDLRRLDTEINKLITYVNAQRAITEKDVNLLVSDASTSSVFDLVDALGKRDGKRAAHELHHLLDQGENPLGLLAMIVRQYRLLILVKECRRATCRRTPWRKSWGSIRLRSRRSTSRRAIIGTSRNWRRSIGACWRSRRRSRRGRLPMCWRSICWWRGWRVNRGDDFFCREVSRLWCGRGRRACRLPGYV